MIQFNSEQQSALNAMLAGQDVFLTGFVGMSRFPPRLNTAISTSRGTGGSRRRRKRMRSSTETRSSRVRVEAAVGSRSSGRDQRYS